MLQTEIDIHPKRVSYFLSFFAVKSMVLRKKNRLLLTNSKDHLVLIVKLSIETISDCLGVFFIKKIDDINFFCQPQSKISNNYLKKVCSHW